MTHTDCSCLSFLKEEGLRCSAHLLELQELFHSLELDIHAPENSALLPFHAKKGSSTSFVGLYESQLTFPCLACGKKEVLSHTACLNAWQRKEFYLHSTKSKQSQIQCYILKNGSIKKKLTYPSVLVLEN